MSYEQYIFTKRLLTKQMNNLRNHKFPVMLFCCRNAVRSANMTHSARGAGFSRWSSYVRCWYIRLYFRSIDLFIRIVVSFCT